MLARMAYPTPEFMCAAIERWWNAIRDTVDDLLHRYAPAGGEETRRLPRMEVSALSTALGIFEAMMRRMLVIMAAELGPAPAPEGLPRLLFRIDECPPEPVIRQSPAGDPDYLLKPPPARALPHRDQNTDGLASTAGILRRLRALAHVYDHGEAYLAALRARLCAPLKPLPTPPPDAFTDRALLPEQTTRFLDLHEVALEAQIYDSS